MTKVYVWLADGRKGEAGPAWYSRVRNSPHSAPGVCRPPPHTSLTLQPAAIPRLLHSRLPTTFKWTLEPLWRQRHLPLSCQLAATSRRRQRRQRRRQRGSHRQNSGVRHCLSGRPLPSEMNSPTSPGQRPHPSHRRPSCWPLPRHDADRLAPVDASQPSSLGSSATWKPAACGTKQSMDILSAVHPLSPAARLIISSRSSPESTPDSRRSQPTRPGALQLLGAAPGRPMIARALPNHQRPRRKCRRRSPPVPTGKAQCEA